MSWQFEINSKIKKQKYLDSSEWAVLKRFVRNRANGICERCLKYPLSDVHHLTYDRLYAENLDDLQGLCRRCHQFVHGRISDDPLSDEKWISPRRIKTFAEKYCFVKEFDESQQETIAFADDDIDAFVLRVAGLNCGVYKKKTASSLIIPSFIGSIILCFCDVNKLIEIGNKLTNDGREIYFVRPAVKFATWDKMLEQTTPNVIAVWIKQYTKKWTLCSNEVELILSNWLAK